MFSFPKLKLYSSRFNSAAFTLLLNLVSTQNRKFKKYIYINSKKLLLIDFLIISAINNTTTIRVNFTRSLFLHIEVGINSIDFI